MSEQKFWMGDDPDVCGDAKCDICHHIVTDVFVDGVTKMGPWAIMCESCHSNNGLPLGTGRGQKYVRQPDKRWLKVEG